MITIEICRLLAKASALRIVGIPAVLLAATLACCGDVMYVTDINHGYVMRMDTTTGSSSGYARVFYPQGLALDHAGNLYVAQFYGDAIQRYTQPWVGTVFASTGLNRPTALAFDSRGNLYAANRGNHTVAKFAPSGASSVFASTGLSYPYGLAVDRADNVFVASAGNNTITRFTPEGLGTVFAHEGLDSPHGLAFDSAGYLYAANYAGTIMKFAPDGTGSVFASAGLNGPWGLAFDSTDNLFVGNIGNNTIVRISSDGTPSLFASGMHAPAYLVIQQIPEPSSSLLLGIGTLAMLIFLRPSRAVSNCAARPAQAASSGHEPRHSKSNS